MSEPPDSSGALPPDTRAFLQRLLSLSTSDWNRALKGWRRLKQQKWALSFQAAEARALAEGLKYEPHEIESVVWETLHEPLEHMLRSHDPLQASLIEIELLEVATVAAKALTIRQFLEPGLFALIYSPFARSIPTAGPGMGTGCLFALLPNAR